MSEFDQFRKEVDRAQRGVFVVLIVGIILKVVLMVALVWAILEVVPFVLEMVGKI